MGPQYVPLFSLPNAAATAAAALLLCLVSGCSGPETGKLSGKVTLPGGKPLAQGSVLFENTEKGVSVNAPLGSDGTYTVRTHDRAGLPPGTYKVAVTPSTFGSGDVPLAEDPSKQASAASEIPAKYRSTATSGLTVTVKPGTNPALDIELRP